MWSRIRNFDSTGPQLSLVPVPDKIMLSLNETRKMAIKSHSNVKPKHEAQTYQYTMKKWYKTYRYFIKNYRYRNGTNLPVPEDVKKSKQKITCEKY
jgi:hypothetical protein